ncbi:MAG: hypothetical protein QM775_35870 [Pirellulales bacterium]
MYGRLSKLIALMFVAVLFGAAPAIAVAADEDDKLVAERDKLWEQAQQLRTESKYAEAARVGREMLAVERKICEADDEDIPVTLTWLAEVNKAHEQWDDAQKLREEASAWYRRVSGPEHWQTIDADYAVAQLATLRKLTRDQRGELSLAEQNCERGKLRTWRENSPRRENFCKTRLTCKRAFWERSIV